jgi:hypothetical protein
MSESKATEYRIRAARLETAIRLRKTKTLRAPLRKMQKALIKLAEIEDWLDGKVAPKNHNWRLRIERFPIFPASLSRRRFPRACRSRLRLSRV